MSGVARFPWTTDSVISLADFQIASSSKTRCGTAHLGVTEKAIL